MVKINGVKVNVNSIDLLLEKHQVANVRRPTVTLAIPLSETQKRLVCFYRRESRCIDPVPGMRRVIKENMLSFVMVVFLEVCLPT